MMNVYPRRLCSRKYMAREQYGSPGRDRNMQAVWENSIKLLGMKAWKTKAKDRQFWRQHIEEAKARYGL
jgi:hypothetical protein